jgi:hypothetical protein
VIAVWAVAALVCAASVIAGRALLAALGRREWSWLAAPVGLAALVIVAQPLVRLPGRGVTAAAAIGALLVVALAYAWRRPPGVGAAALVREALPVALIVLLAASIPFALNGRVGVLGEGIYTNDHAAQLFWSEWLATGFGPEPRGIEFGYPLGPQSLAAALAEGTGASVETAFNGLLLAIPVLTALASLAVLREQPPLRRTTAAALVGLPYLAASFLAQSAFKETAMALFLVGVAVALTEMNQPRDLQADRAVPGGTASRHPLAATLAALGVLVLASVLTFSLAGAVWPLAAAAIWLGFELAAGRIRLSAGDLAAALRPAWPALAAAAALLAVVAVAQAGTLSGFLDRFGDIQASTGRLISSVSPREALGIWPEGDFRADVAGDPEALLATLIGLAGAAAAAWWWVRRRGAAVPAALAAAVLVYAGARWRGGIHVEAKALAVMAPIAILFVVRALLATDWRGRWRTPIAALAVVFVVGAAGSTLLALRAAPVGTEQRAGELETLREEVEGRRVLVLVADRFASYRLRGALVGSPGGYVPSRDVKAREGKRWDQGRALDFDSVTSEVLNEYRFVITANAAYASSPPPQFERVAATPSYTLWKRRGRVPPQEVIEPPDAPGAVLDCKRPAGRRLSRRAGVATVGPEPVVGRKRRWRPAASFTAGGVASQTFTLDRGEWAISLQYHSPVPIEREAPGIRAELPASLDGMFGFAPGEGQFWPAGTIEVAAAGPVGVSVRQRDRTWLQRQLRVEPRTWLGSVALTPVAGTRGVPLADACGRYVDRYTLEPRD